ncbi:MAG: ABC transporter ATP-binding protein [Ilumatobacteraceae bacterium]
MNAAIETHGLTKWYGQSRGIVELDLRVEQGEVFGFLGPNGAGKSTTIRTLLDFQRATSGSAEVLGLDIVRDSVAIRRRVGYLSGDLRLFDRMTAAQHVAWFARARGATDDSLTASLIDRFSVEMDRPVHELSTGNRQKVGLLLAFMHRPDVLILDEPTTGLNPLMQAEFDGLLRETAAAGRTVLLSSHSLDEVQRVADRVAIIRDGRLVITDTVQHMRANAVRVVTMQFDRTVPAAVFTAIPSVRHAQVAEHQIELRVSGDIRPVLEAGLANGLVDLAARHADLDELFLSYYRRPEAEDRAS